MDWTAGYASDVEYTAGFYQEQSPAFLNFVCVLNGTEPIPLDKPFTYFELGFGRGVTVNVLAASNPQGQFYAADFNPAHVAGARELASAAGLSNLTLFEDSFAELAAGKEVNLPQFDFITLHGIYTWVTAENQQHIVNFIGRYLKPGGIVYLSYNAMPGWTAALPLQRLLVEYADAFPNRSNLQIEGAADLVQKMEDLAAGYIVANPPLLPRLKTLKTGNRNYLVHEYMHKHWAPRYHADIARDLADAKMDYVGSADLPFAYESLYLTEEKRSIVSSMNDSAMRETMKDYFLNTGFRKDVFVRGARKLNPLKQAEYLSQVGGILMTPKEDINLALKLSIGEVQGKPELFSPIIDALAQRPTTIQELSKLPSLKGQAIASLAQVVALLAASGHVAIYWANSQQNMPTTAHNMNREIAKSTRYSDEFQVLCSSVLGNGVVANYIERLTYLVSLEPGIALDVNTLTPKVWAIIQKQGRRMIKDGQPLDSEQDNLEELKRQISEIFTRRLPLWEQLKLR